MICFEFGAASMCLFFFRSLFICFCISKSFAFCHRHQNQPCLWTIFWYMFFLSPHFVSSRFFSHSLIFFSFSLLWFSNFFSSSRANSISTKTKNIEIQCKMWNVPNIWWYNFVLTIQLFFFFASVCVYGMYMHAILLGRFFHNMPQIWNTSPNRIH